VAQTFVDIRPGNLNDLGSDPADSGVFSVGGVRLRQATARNAPSVINAVFNVRNFWDGRAREIFTGATPFGDSDQAANVLVDSNQELTLTLVRLDQSSLASQAVGPPLNAVEDVVRRPHLGPTRQADALASTSFPGNRCRPPTASLAPWPILTAWEYSRSTTTPP
jgi:cytochrome c peroxidase